MEVNKIVEQQIRHTFPESNVLGEESVGLNIGADARISLIKDNGVLLKFAAIDGFDVEYITAFFRGRTSSNDSVVYFYEDGISIYPRYNSVVSGVEKLKRSMDIFNRFKNLHTHFILLKKIINES